MGGIFSGRTAYATTPDDRDCLKIDVNEFTEILDDDRGVAGTYSWPTGASISWATITDHGRDGIRLQYSLDEAEDEDECERSYPVWITRTECNFGGTRPWFRCPRCEKRLGKLYLPPDEAMFLCRHCHDFGYTSSRASGNVDRTLRMRFNRIRQKLDAEPTHPNNWDAIDVDRPKGMHQDTYDELMIELRKARDKWEEEAFFSTLRQYADDAPFAVDG